ncbi:hypothetical protein D3C71_1722290 [compost metagenome]
MLIAFQLHFGQWRNQLAGTELLADKSLTAHGNANVVHCRSDGQIGTIESYSRRGIQIDIEMLSPAVPFIRTRIIAPGLTIVEQGAV